MAAQRQVTGAQADESTHPVLRAQREQRRGGALEASRMESSIARTFGIRIDSEKLDDDDCKRLLELHQKASHPQDWQEPGRGHYGLINQLTAEDRAEWRRLVGKAAGVDLDLLDEDLREAARMRELARLAQQPAPLHMTAPPGWAVLPRAVLSDVHRGRLRAIDVAVLWYFTALFASGTLHPRLEERREASWQDDGDALLVRGDWTRLLPEGWGDPLGMGGVDAIMFMQAAIIERLTSAGWLRLEHPTANETLVRLGERFRQEEMRAVGLGRSAERKR